MAPDVRSLLAFLSTPGFRYRDLHTHEADAPPSYAAVREGLTIVALMSLVRDVGRTTLAANLAVRLGRRGLRAVALDLDPRATLAAHFRGRSPLSVPFDDAGARAPRVSRVESLIRWVEPEVGLVPYGENAAALAVQEASAACEVLVLDTPAGASSQMLEQALLEADEIIVVARPDAASRDAIAPTEEFLARVRGKTWRRAPARYLINQFDGRRASDQETLSALRRSLGGRVFPQPIQEDAAVRVALRSGRCLEDVAKGSQVVADLDALAERLFPAHRPRSSAPRTKASPGLALEEARRG